MNYPKKYQSRTLDKIFALKNITFRYLTSRLLKIKNRDVGSR